MPRCSSSTFSSSQGNALPVVTSGSSVGLTLPLLICATMLFNTLTRSWPFTRATSDSYTLGIPPGMEWLTVVAGMGAPSIYSCLHIPLDATPLLCTSSVAAPHPPHILRPYHRTEGPSHALHLGPPVPYPPPKGPRASEKKEEEVRTL